jgi:VWFA-related protein
MAASFHGFVKAALPLFVATVLAACATQSQPQASQPTQAVAPAPLKLCPLPDAPPKDIASKAGYVQYVVTVIDESGGPVEDLKQSDFDVSANGRNVPIAYFRDDRDAMPASLAVIIDSSGSMTKKFAATSQSKMQTVSNTVRVASASLNACDELTLVVFAPEFTFIPLKNDKASVAEPLTTDHQAVMDKIDSLKPWGQTPLYDSIDLAERQLTEAHYPNRSIVVITDGIDNTSYIHKAALVQEVESANVPMDVVGIGDETKDLQGFSFLPGLNQRDAVDGAVLLEIASASQGHFWLVSTTANDSGDKLLAALTSASKAAGYAYTIGFVRPPGLPTKIFVKSRKRIYVHAHQETLATP